MNFQNYLLQNEGDAVRGFLRSIGYQINTPQSAAVCLADYLKKNGEDGMRQLLPLHPDYGMIAELVEEANRKDRPAIVSTETDNASGAVVRKSEPSYPAHYLGPLSLEGIRGDLVNVALILLCVYLLAKIIK